MRAAFIGRLTLAAGAVTLAASALPTQPAAHTVPGSDATHGAARAVPVAPAVSGRSASAATSGSFPVQPNDAFFSDQWGLSNISAPQAWQQQQASGAGVIVAVIDSGVDLGHEDLACTGKLHVVDGSDLSAGDDDPDDEFGHGTHVAGIVGACTHNGVGMAGVAPASAILPVRVLDAGGGTTNLNSIVAGIDLATAAGAHVINMSLDAHLAGAVPAFVPGLLTEFDAAIARAVDQGVVVVAAAGNDGYSLCGYPSLAAKVICVGAIDRRDLKAFYSNMAYKTGTDEDSPAVVAPGGSLVAVCDLPQENVLSLWPADLDGCDEGRRGYTAISGTSMAAPHVAGVAALVYGRLGGIRTAANAATVRRTIMQTADDLGVPGLDPIFGFGRVNALRAVQAVDVVALPPSAPVPGAPAPGSVAPSAGPRKAVPLRQGPGPLRVVPGRPAKGSLAGSPHAAPVPLVDPSSELPSRDGAGHGWMLLSLVLAVSGGISFTWGRLF